MAASMLGQGDQGGEREEEEGTGGKNIPFKGLPE
jgi:hypothetical protein